MKHWRDIKGLNNVLQALNKYGESAKEEAQKAMTDVLIKKLEFTQEQARLYASTVLSRNAESSTDCTTINANKVTGTWISGTQSGIPGGWQTTKQETWEFMSDLTFEHKRNTYEYYWSPFSSYSRPTSWSEHGFWAPSDSEPGNELYIVVIAFQDGIAQQLRLIWNDDSVYPRKFSLGQTVFVRQH
jgi:hypothetical protein